MLPAGDDLVVYTKRWPGGQPAHRGMLASGFWLGAPPGLGGGTRYSGGVPPTSLRWARAQPLTRARLFLWQMSKRLPRAKLTISEGETTAC